jgi:hypothetical protein
VAVTVASATRNTDRLFFIFNSSDLAGRAKFIILTRLKRRPQIAGGQVVFGYPAKAIFDVRHFPS